MNNSDSMANRARAEVSSKKRSVSAIRYETSSSETDVPKTGRSSSLPPSKTPTINFSPIPESEKSTSSTSFIDCSPMYRAYLVAMIEEKKVALKRNTKLAVKYKKQYDEKYAKMCDGMPNWRFDEFEKLAKEAAYSISMVAYKLGKAQGTMKAEQRTIEDLEALLKKIM